MAIGGLSAGRIANSLRSSGALSKAGSTVKSGLSGVKTTALGGGVVGYTGANVEQLFTDATGADGGVGSSVRRLTYALGALMVVYVVGQLIDVQVGG